MFNITGVWIGITELELLFIFSYALRHKWETLKQINVVSYYWYMVTILTLVWEFSFVMNYCNTSIYAKELLKDEKHVWSSYFDLSYILPWKLSEIFYAEYAAYADREYYSFKDYWSRVIESSHAIFCGTFSLAAIISKIRLREKHYLITGSIAMSAQLMNSILYMVEYGIQMSQPYNVNYNNASFPAGKMLSKRPFMWVNIFWTIMPLYTLFLLLNRASISITKITFST